MSRAGLRRADLVFFFATVEHAGKYAEMLAAVRRITGCRNLVGCSGAGVLATEGEIEDEEGVAVLALAGDHTTAAPFLVGNLRGRDREAGREIGQIVNPHRRGESVLVLFPDTLNCKPEQLFRGLAESLTDVPVAGGGAADDGAGKKTFQMCGGQVISNGVAGVLLTGELISTIGVTQSCRPIGRTMEVTGAEGDVITSLDGGLALEALRASVGKQFAADLERLAAFLFLGVPLEEVSPGSTLERGSYVVRNIIGVNGDTGAVAVGKKVSLGERVCFMLRDPVSARDDLKAMLAEETALGVHGENRFGLYFNCCARGSGLYGMPGIDTAFINSALGPLPLAGFFGFCEIAWARGAAHLHNYSGVMTLISEQPQVSGEEPLQ
jgi:small ligand-binding sensory domain FIST